MGQWLGSPCRAFDGRQGTCRAALESPTGKEKLDVTVHGHGSKASMEKGPLVCKVCAQFAERAVNKSGCCTGEFMDTDALTGAGVCNGCNSDSACPWELPVCDRFTQQCKCSRDSCWEGYRCFNHRGVEVRQGEAGTQCACNIQHGQANSCKSFEVCRQGRCVPGGP